MVDLLNNSNLFLIGMPGCGKSSVGKLLAHSLPNYEFVDSDQQIEELPEFKHLFNGELPNNEESGKIIKYIFQELGEEKFRDLESNILKKISHKTNQVVATGGGIVVNPANWQKLNEGLTIWLDVPIDVLETRLASNSSRPLFQGDYLKGENLFSKLEFLEKERKHLYAQSKLTIRITSESSLLAIVEKILAQLQQHL